jgi:hypothetical protein
MRIVRFVYLFLALMLLSLQAMGMPHGGSVCADATQQCCGQTGAGKVSGEPEQLSGDADCCTLQAGPQPVVGLNLPGAFMAPQQPHIPHPLAARAIAPPLRPPAG